MCFNYVSTCKKTFSLIQYFLPYTPKGIIKVYMISIICNINPSLFDYTLSKYIFLVTQWREYNGKKTRVC